jgi:hypothetical protein
MGLVKFEVEIPNFEKELSINITIRRDGEVFYSTSSPSMDNINEKTQSDINPVSKSFGVLKDTNTVEGITPEEPKKRKKAEKLELETQQETTPAAKKRGNFMNVEF